MICGIYLSAYLNVATVCFHDRITKTEAKKNDEEVKTEVKEVNEETKTEE